MEIWELIVYCGNGHVYNILGDEDIFKAELIAWKQWQFDSAQKFEEQSSFGGECNDTTGFEVREVQGFANDVSRLPAVLGYQFEDIQGMIIRRVL